MSYYSFPDKATAADVAKYMSLVSSIFLKLIKMIIGPLVLSTLVVGIGHMGDAATVGRVGAKTMGWFVSASIVSLLLASSWSTAAARRRHRDRRSGRETPPI